MKMLFALSSILGLIILCNSVDGRVEETVELRLLNADLNWSEADVQKMLEKADFEGKGYDKEETITLVSSKGSAPAVYRKSVYYFKVVKCSEELAVMEEIDRLMPGGIKRSDLVELRKDLKAIKMLPNGHCQPGVQFHFNSQRNCDRNGSGIVKRDTQGVPAVLRKLDFCFFCGICV